ncbi:MAG TPA: serine/threonine protein kinase [Pseudoxanthomonas sp.]
MELDELKNAWQTLDRRLERQNAINLLLLKDDRTKRMRSSLRPLFWGQLAQMGFGLLFVLLAAALWMRAGSVPLNMPWYVVLAGIFVHAYGVVAIALAGGTMGLIRTIDYSAPVLGIQKQLSRLRKLYIANGMIAGLPWWFMWVPVLMVLAALAGVDIYAKAPSVVWIGMGVGIADLLATWWFHRWSRSPERPKLAKAVEDSVTGSSLCNAQRIAGEIAQFEKE